MKIRIEPEQQQPATEVMPNLGDIYVDPAGRIFMLSYLGGDVYGWVSIGGKSLRHQMPKSNPRSADILLGIQDLTIGKNYFPASQMELNIKPADGCWYGKLKLDLKEVFDA